MIYLDTNGHHVRERPRATIIPRAPHPPGQGACSEREPCSECAAAYASEDERDTDVDGETANNEGRAA
jgi:hypothetical protein